MAIVKMKKLRVVTMADQKDALLKGLLHLGCVEINDPSGKLTDPAWAETLLKRANSQLTSARKELAEANTALGAIKRYAGIKDGMFPRRDLVEESVFLSEATVEQAREVSREICEKLQDVNRLQGEEHRLISRKAALEPWATLEMPLECAGTANTMFRLGVCPAATDAEAIRKEMEAADVAAELYEISEDRHQKYLLLVCHRQDEESVQELLRGFGFSVVMFQDVAGTAKENITKLEALLEENRKEQDTAISAIVQKADGKTELRIYADRMGAEVDRESHVERLMTNGTICFFEGWAPAERMEEISSLLDSLDCAWEAEDPLEEEYPQVPVQLKNNWFTRPLNMVTEMYSLPAYNTVDPNPFMAPFFILFYGIMMADMGYGLLMMLASLFIMKRSKPNGQTMRHMIPLLGLCGVSTFIMGALTGGFFGDFLTQFIEMIRPGTNFALPALFTPLNDTLMILIGSMCLGFVHIITGMAISVVSKIKRGQIMDAVWNEITWWIVFAGIALTVLGITSIPLIVGLVLVVAGPVITGKGLGKITGIFASLYNNITGYFGDILSYSRLMALMMAGSVIAQVFNTLGTIPGNVVFFIVIASVGNILNFGLNLLGCYVHDMRLQCLEFFGKFYEDGGKPFRPLKFNTKYIDIQ